jgi:RNA polymerase sigma factor (sigma-70 family)
LATTFLEMHMSVRTFNEAEFALDKIAGRDVSDHLEQLRPVLMRVARQCLSDDLHDAEDAVQEAMCCIYRKPMQHAGAPLAWTCKVLKRICWRLAKRRHRLTGKEQEFTGELADCVCPRPEQLVAREELRSLIRKHIAKLPEELQMVLHLRFFEGMNHSQMASRLGVGPMAIDTLLRRATKHIRRLLTPSVCSGTIEVE